MPLMSSAELDRRPIVVAIAGPNGAGKTTFFHAHLAPAGLRFVNADVLAAELAVGPYEAARLANALREALVERGESFVFETVLSDPAVDKVAFLADAARRGYVVVLSNFKSRSRSGFGRFCRKSGRVNLKYWNGPEERFLAPFRHVDGRQVRAPGRSIVSD